MEISLELDLVMFTALMQEPLKGLEKICAVKSETFFIYSCMARRRFLQDLIRLEIEPFAKTATTSGFFTYSEFYT